MSTLNFKIVTPEKTVYENNGVFQVSLPTMTGEITVLPNHIPLVTVLKAGELKLKDNAGDQVIAVAGGFVEVKGENQIVVLADNAERAEEIDVARAEEARQRAEEEMAKIKNVQDVDFAKLQAIIDREMNRLRVARKYKNLPQSKSE
ncbi:MAG: F0F1 ATP synthase subunit epsilon [Candidatus Komeilibacteria bacterium]|nr:F0F1 ATP synthase subunit epsilon [Candidatus Komeilibacteria bacterium]